MSRTFLAMLAMAGSLVALPGPGGGVGAATAAPERIASDDPAVIAVEIARQIAGGDLGQLTDLIITTAEAPADAIVSAGLAGYLDLCPRPAGAPCRRTATLLTGADELPTTTAQAILASGVPAARITVLGGAAAVSDAVHAEIATLAGWNGRGANPVVRVGGATRYGTAAALVEHLHGLASQPGAVPLPASYRTVILANGESAADALAASAVAYRGGHLLLLSPAAAPTAALERAVQTLGANCALVVGGTAALAMAVETAVAAALSSTGSGACAPERLAGEDRAHTATLVASRLVARYGSPRSMLVANSRTGSVPLTAAPLSRLNTGVLFTGADALSAATREWLARYPSLGAVALVGTEAALPATIGRELVLTPPAPVEAGAGAGGGGAGGGGGAALSLAYSSATFDTAQSSQVLAATLTGGSAPFSYAVTAGTLPTGVSFDATSGAFTGPAVWSLGSVVTVSAGVSHSCAVLDDTTVRCWGRNGSGQLGDGTTTDRWNPVTVTTGAGTPLSDVVHISAGAQHTCAVLADASARCWGNNFHGQIGDGSNDNRSTPVAVVTSVGGPALGGITQVSTGDYLTCAVLVDTTVRCWGQNGSGQLGDGTTTDRSNQVAVTTGAGTPLADVTQISAGSFHTCALLANTEVRCWGGNGKGQLGDGTTTDRWNPVAVTTGAGTPLDGVTQISAGLANNNTSAHSCAVLVGGTAQCWGADVGGQLGTGNTSIMARTTPVTVGGSSPLTGITEISAGWEFTCVVLTDTTARCWGWRGQGPSAGRLGDAVLSGTQTTPAVVLASGGGATLSGVSQISARWMHVCSALTDGSARCWGNNGQNGSGALGDGTMDIRPTAVRVLASGTEANNPTPLGGSLAVGPATLTVTVTDGNGATASATVTLTSGP